MKEARVAEEEGLGSWGEEVEVGDWFRELALFHLFIFYERAEIFWVISIHPNGIWDGVYPHEFYIAQYVSILLYNRFITKILGTRTLVECRIEENHLRILAGTFSIKFDQPKIADET